ncbi:tetratricopeptide repeat protein [Yoonia sp. R2-816]|uniref:tetratricopeptide repeat protein n=1 Tax=Yoonia sp. R2-816 TaxID=3342638 RepID=UPI0037277A52
MFERALHGDNIAAAFAVAATTADLTIAAGTATTITAALSGVAIYKSADKPVKALAQQMARLMETALASAQIADQRKRIVVQMLGQYQPNETAFVRHDLNAAAIADSLCHQITTTAKDPAHKTDIALRDFTTVIIATLTPVLEDPAVIQWIQPAIFKALLERTQKSGQADRLRDEGITEKAIIRLAQRYSEGITDVGEAWLELQNAMDVAVRVQQEGRVTSNQGNFVDAVLRRVADLAAQGAYVDAGAAIDAALAEEEAAHTARKIRLLDRGVEIARLDNNPRKAASLRFAKLQIQVPPNASFDHLRGLQNKWYWRGRDRGLRFDLEVAMHLAERSVSLSQSKKQQGMALNDLGNALCLLGERQTGTERLEQAVAAYTSALNKRDRSQSPTDWAMTQNNLGNAQAILGARESGTDHLEQAVTAFGAALQVKTPDSPPQYRATIQNNLGNTWAILGERKGGTAELEQALAAYTAALQVRTRDIAPMDWAMTQNNLGNALCTLGEREDGTEQLEQAIAACNAALQERTQDKVPLDWATTQDNLGKSLTSLAIREGRTDRLHQAVTAFTAALSVRKQDQLPLNWATSQNNLGHALTALGIQEGDEDRLEQAVVALNAATEHCTLESSALEWAKIQCNLAKVAIAFFDLTGGVSRLDQGQAYLELARQVYANAGAASYVAVTDRLLIDITNRRDALS